MVTKKQEELFKIRKEIAEILMKQANGDKEKAKELLEEIAGKGQTSIKALDLDLASRILELLKTENKSETKQNEEIEEDNKDLLPVPFGSPQGPLAVITDKYVDKAIAIMEKVNNFAIAKLKQINPKDFVIFGDVVCLRGSGIDKFLTGLFLPVELTNVKELPQEKTPNGYPIFRFQGEATNTITGMTIPIYSEESSEKKFYCYRRSKQGKRYKLPPDQVNLRDVRVACHRGLRKEVVKCFFGLRGMSIEEAESRGIDTKCIYRVPFKEG